MATRITPYHAKYYAALLMGQSSNGDLSSLSQSLLSSTVDINPHQIDAALFAFSSPFSKGVVLADEVGLGKTIEAGLVLCQYAAQSVQEKIALERRVDEQNRKKRRLRNELEDREDEVAAQRKSMISELEKRLITSTNLQDLFLIRWTTIKKNNKTH